MCSQYVTLEARFHFGGKATSWITYPMAVNRKVVSIHASGSTDKKPHGGWSIEKWLSNFLLKQSQDTVEGWCSVVSHMSIRIVG